MQGETSLFWRTCAGLACVLLTATVMNSAVFPMFDPLFTYARDVSVLANSAVLVALGLVASFRPAWVKARIGNVATAVFLALGAGLLELSIAVASPVLLTVSACMLAVARAWVTVAVGLAASRLSLSRMGMCVALAFIAQFVAETLLWFLPALVSVLLFFVLPVLALLLTAGEAMPLFEETQRGEAPADLAVTQPSTFLPLAGPLFGCLFLFRIAFGFSLRFGEVGGVPLPDFFSVVAVGIVAIALVVTAGKHPSADLVAQVSVLCVVAGFFAVAALGAPAHVASVTLLSSGNALFDIVAWTVLISVAGRNHAAAVAVLSWGRGVSGVGTIVGAGLGVWATNMLGSDSQAMEIAAGTLILVFVGYALIGLRKFSFAGTIMGVTAAVQQEPVAASAEEEFERRCRSLGERFALSPREQEVFGMLARGRNREYIQEQLVVSRNTVKAHVKHVYAKLGIHTHQELLDLVENASVD